jgi:uncharacterized protein
MAILFWSCASCGQSTGSDSTSTTSNMAVAKEAQLPEMLGWASDYEGLFTKEQNDSLNNLVGDFEKKTTIQMALVTVDSSFVQRNEFNDLALRFLNTWGVGRKDINNGMVVLISASYRTMRISNGYGIEKY